MTLLSPRIAPWFIGILAVGAPFRTVSAATVPTGGLRPDVLADLAPHPQGGKNYNEFWTYQIWLTGGIQIQLNLSRANFGSFKDPVCGSDLSLLGFKGHDYFVAREYPVRNFSFDSGKARLAVHEHIFFEGAPPKSHRLHFATAKKGVAYFLDLEFEDMGPGQVWGDGIFHLHGGPVGMYIHIPRATVRGRLAVNGDTIAVEGAAWLDHTWQTQFATKLMDAGYRYVATSGGAEGGYFFQTGNGVFGYGVKEDSGRPQLLQPRALRGLEPARKSGISLPKILDFTFEPPIGGRRFRRDQDRQQTSAFQELNWIEKKGAELFLGGEILSFRGLGKINDSLPGLYSFTVIKR